MKKVLVIAILLFGMVRLAWADFVDYWHVYYNYSLIDHTNEFVIKVEDVKPKDKLRIHYYRDRLQLLDKYLKVVDNSGNLVLLTNFGKETLPFNGDWKTMYLPVKVLLDYRKKTSRSSFEVYYQLGEDASKPDVQTLVLKVKLE